MHPLIERTFFGLPGRDYFRHFVFGLIFPILIFAGWNDYPGMGQLGLPVYALIALNTLLYPYSRFVYESIAAFIMGKHFFYGNAIGILTTKFITMLFCWALALFIAPIGLLYLYVRHNRGRAG